jgi:c-di-GMP-binding flagellar brake protein YcgR
MRSALPVIVMTACENTEVLEQAKHFGVSAYVNKPFDLDNLVSLVRSTSNTTVSGRDRRVPDSTILFAAGQPVTLEIHNGCGARLYMSQIQGKDDRTLSVFTPSNAGQAVNVGPRTCVKVGLATSDAFYSFTTQVLKSSEEPEPVLVLEKPSVIYRVQRREHPRIPIRMPVRCASCSEDGSKTGKFASGETRDLSLGGACMVVPQEMLPGEMLHVEIRPKNSKDRVTAIARVMHSRANLSPESEGHIVGCKFVSTHGPIEKLLIR